MSARRVPEATEAERGLIGALVLEPERIGEAANVVAAADLLNPRLAGMFDLLLRLHASGAGIDAISVAHELADGDKQLLQECMYDPMPSPQLIPRYAAQVVEAATRRRAMFAAADILQAIDGGVTADAIRQQALDLAESLLTVEADRVPTMTVDEYMSIDEDAHPHDAWLIPHIIRRNTRTIVVAREGGGKDTLMRQVGLHAAAGLDPFVPSMRIEPIRVLHIDAENGLHTIQRQTLLANTKVNLRRLTGDRYHLFFAPQGIDLRQRLPRARLEKLLQQTTPDLVLAGPVYKLFHRRGSEDLEQSTLEVLELLDDLRVRYGFSLMLQHHAPKGEGGRSREMVPFGSSVLFRWPEVGLSMDDHGELLGRPDQLTVDLTTFRGNRDPIDWPTQLTRGDPYSPVPWAARWERGRGAAVGARLVGNEWTYTA